MRVLCVFARDSLLVLGLVIVYSMCFLFVAARSSGIQLPGKICLRNDQLCIERDVRPYTVTHSVRSFVHYTLVLCLNDQCDLMQRIALVF